MATGDVTSRFRPRLVSRQRLDAIDADAMSRVATLYGDFMDRALISKTYATSAQAIGEIWTGASVTVNPVAPNDGLLRINSELFVGLDSDGHVVLKPATITLQVAIPVGSYQVYIYDQDVSTATAIKRFITALAPFTEITQATDTEFQGVANLYVRAGNAGTIIPDTVIGGRTTPMIFLGIATNIAGAVTWDQSAAVNRLSTCPGAPTLPTDNAHNGSMANVVDMLKALLYLEGRIKWKGSTHYTPAAGNNFGAYQDPIQGLDVAYRETPGYITIGNGTTVFGDFDANGFADHGALLQAAHDALPNTIGGTILIKQGVSLANIITPVLVTKNVNLVGADPWASLIFGGGAAIVTTAGVSLRMYNLSIVCPATCVQLGDGRFIAENCKFNGVGTVTPMIVVAGGATIATDVVMRNCYCVASTTADSSSVNTIFEADSPLTNALFEGCHFEMNTQIANFFYISELRSNVKWIGCDFKYTTDAMTLMARGTAILLRSTSNGDAGDVNGRIIQGCSFQGNLTDANSNYAFAPVGEVTPISHLLITDCTFLRCTGVNLQGGSAEITINNCRFIKTGLSLSGSIGDGSIRNMTVQGCLFQNSQQVQIYPNNDVVNLMFNGCRFITTSGNNVYAPIDVQPVTGSVTNLKIKDCIIVGDAFQDPIKVATLLTSGHSVSGFEFSGNELSGFSNATTDNAVLGFYVHTYDVIGAKVYGNTFRDIQNVTYNGTANDNSNGSFRICEFGGSTITSLTIQGNQFNNIATSYTPAAGKHIAAGHCVRITPHIAGATTGKWDNILITGNVFGSFGSQCNPLVVDGGKVTDTVHNDLRILKFSGNICNYSYVPTTETFPWIGDIQIKWNGGANAATIIISDNIFAVLHTFGGAGAQRNMVEFNGPAATILQITGNKFNASNFDYLNGWGVGSSNGLAADELIVCKNCGSNTGSSIGTHGMTTLDNSLPVIPALGSAWTDNIRLVNN